MSQADFNTFLEQYIQCGPGCVRFLLIKDFSKPGLGNIQPPVVNHTLNPASLQGLFMRNDSSKDCYLRCQVAADRKYTYWLQTPALCWSP